ncbi:hypothetical protein [Conservatibacter flavescens]|uniref:Uncharacterized protein n=1 Tax=Conservatibacter flavescens TaxID=28161 RepID=A0A2M8S4Y6_9PAST|nr:hypothetical protein [Conservatibacter flavescens]PJG86194.1 hypothetical protein CVP05_03215 [Conservatibacter flavescens]
MLKESDLIVGHKYASNTEKTVEGLLGKREILKIYPSDGFVTYCELKERKNKSSYSVVATMKTISIKSFLRWAKIDITKKENR